MKRGAQARWEKGLKDGQGYLGTDSRVLDGTRYSFATRFGDEAGTNPEELIAAAHAGCFSMSLVYHLESAGLAPEVIETSAELSFRFDQDGPNVEGIHLRVRATVPGVDDDAFQRMAAQAKEACLVSRLLNTTITMDASLETEAASTH